MAVSLQIKKNTYYAVFWIQGDDGKQHQKWVSTKISADGHHKRAAMTKAKEIAALYEENHLIDYPKILFSDWVGTWLNQKRAQIDVITYEGYASYAKNHITPYFSAKKLTLRDISPQHIQDYYNSKIKDPDKPSSENKDKLSGKSLKSHHIVIRGALEDAVRKNIIPYNPADRVSVPKKEKYTGKFYTEKEAMRLLEALHGDIIEPVVTLTLFYGMRRSEVLGLKWSAVDFKKQTISVEATVVRFSRVVCKEKTKNASSRRTYPMIPEISQILKKVRKQQAESQIMYGSAYMKSDYVFTWPDGKQFAPDFVTRHFSMFLKNNNFPHIRFHDLRHTTASLLISKGYQLKDIQEWLGHSDIGTTANIYGHLDFESKRQTASEMGSLFTKCK